MGRESLQGSAVCPEEDDAEEFRRILQSDDIAPVDEASYATRLVEIILRALKHKLPWSQVPRGRISADFCCSLKD